MSSARRNFTLSALLLVAVLLGFLSLSLLKASVASGPANFIRSHLNLATGQCPTSDHKIQFWADLTRARITYDAAFDAIADGVVNVSDAIMLNTAMLQIMGSCETPPEPFMHIVDDQESAFSPKEGTILEGGYGGNHLKVNIPNDSVRSVEWDLGTLTPGEYDIYLSNAPNGAHIVRYSIGDLLSVNISQIRWELWKNSNFTELPKRWWAGQYWTKIGSISVDQSMPLILNAEGRTSHGSTSLLLADAAMIVRQGEAVCGNGIQESFEACDSDAQCSTGYSCNACQNCATKVTPSLFRDWVSLKVPHAYNGESQVAVHNDELWSVGAGTGLNGAQVYRNGSWQPAAYGPSDTITGHALVEHKGMLLALGGEGKSIPGPGPGGFSYEPAGVMTLKYDWNNQFTFFCQIPKVKKSVSAVSFRGRLWIAGYYNTYDSGVSLYASGDRDSDICEFSLPGATYDDSGNIVTYNPPFRESRGTLAVLHDRLWFIGLSHVYSSADGISWKMESPTPWNPDTSWHNILAFSSGGKFWIMRGQKLYVSDDGKIWNNVDQAPFLSASAVVPYRGGILFGTQGNPSQPPSTCGDGLKNGFDYCDGNDLNDKTCEDMGYDTGILSCVPAGDPDECSFNTNECDYDYAVTMRQTLVGGTVTPEETDVTVLRFSLNTEVPLRLNAISVDVVSENPEALEQVSLWSDANGDGVSEKIAARKATSTAGQLLFSVENMNNPNGILNLPSAGEYLLEIRAHISSAHGTQPLTLNAMFPQSILSASGLDGVKAMAGVTWNGERCAEKPCDIKIDFTPITWTFDAPYCGDRVIQPEIGEQCEDDNDEPFDGCHKCREIPYRSGLSWSQAAWAPPTDFSVLAFKGKLWSIGDSFNEGIVNSFTPGQPDFVWKREASGLPLFHNSWTDAVVHDGKMWVIGGKMFNGVVQGTVRYSDDGIHWQESVRLPAGYTNSNPLLASYKEKLWLIGGGTNEMPFHSGDVYSFDTRNGTAWQRENLSPPLSQFGNKYNVTFVRPHGAVHQDKFWLLSQPVLLSTSDGLHWSATADNVLAGAEVVAHNNELYLFGKKILRTTDGLSWSWSDPPPYNVKSIFSLNGKIWVTTWQGVFVSSTN